MRPVCHSVILNEEPLAVSKIVGIRHKNYPLVNCFVLSRKLFANVNSLFANESKVVIMGRHLARQS